MKKLARDLIPEVIPADKIDQYQFTTVDDETYGKLLRAKLQEEVDEFLEEENMEELADVLEVLDAFIAYKKFNEETVAEVKRKKREERGGFFNKLQIERIEKCGD